MTDAEWRRNGRRRRKGVASMPLKELHIQKKPPAEYGTGVGLLVAGGRQKHGLR